MSKEKKTIELSNGDIFTIIEMKRGIVKKDFYISFVLILMQIIILSMAVLNLGFPKKIVDVLFITFCSFLGLELCLFIDMVFHIVTSFIPKAVNIHKTKFNKRLTKKLPEGLASNKDAVTDVYFFTGVLPGKYIFKADLCNG